MRDLLLRYKTTSAIERNQNEKINSKPFILQEEIACLVNGSDYELFILKSHIKHITYIHPQACHFVLRKD